MKVEIIEGTMEAAGGYRKGGVDFVGDEHEMLVDEAKEVAYATGRQVLEVLAVLVAE